MSFSSEEIFTPGDQPDVLVALNPAALRANVHDLRPGGAVIVNSDAFTAANLAKAGYEKSPLEDGSLRGWSVFQVPVSTLTTNALEGSGLTSKQVDRTKNFFVLGLIFWLYERSMAGTEAWIEQAFGAGSPLALGNLRALHAGYSFGETTEIFHNVTYRVPPTKYAPGEYRNITGNEASTLGFLAASHAAQRPLVYATYPITPASDILHELAAHEDFGVRTIQAEDEIAALGMAIGAAYGGHLGMTGTSGPGFALMSEMLNLAVMVELPLVVVDVQRAGPSTGMPTKMEQSDLLEALFGRNGDSPIPVIAPATPTECFQMAVEAWRIALRHMTPVVYLSDAFLATSSEPWRIPDVSALPDLRVENANDPDTFAPYQRDPRTFTRPWAVPGTPGLEHRVGGLEKLDVTGAVSYSGANHHRMELLRAEKVARIALDVRDLPVDGPDEGDLLILGWGSTFGALRTAARNLRAEGRSVAHAHLRHLNPMPSNTGEVLSRYRRILIPEVNLGQLALLIRARFLVDAQGFNLPAGAPFRVHEVEAAARAILREVDEGGAGRREKELAR